MHLCVKARNFFVRKNLLIVKNLGSMFIKMTFI